jgi:nanoRNase/pAp phosphatase (c-di-AMP/oligoRNAs hydrolase)
VTAVDRSDSAKLTKEEILEPKGWILLSFIMDPRTGLGRYRDFRISNYQMMMDMIDYCSKISIDQILSQHDVKERIDKYQEQDELFQIMIEQKTHIEGNIIITDLRGEEEIYTGNRFRIYAMYPEQNISIWLIDGKQNENAVFAVGASIINKSSETDVGNLMLHFGGGGHKKVGTCQVPYSEVDRVLAELIDEINDDT